jgi:hypothetical protein
MLYSSYVYFCHGAFGIEEGCRKPNLEIGSKLVVVASMIDSRLVVDVSSDEYVINKT